MSNVITTADIGLLVNCSAALYYSLILPRPLV